MGIRDSGVNGPASRTASISACIIARDAADTIVTCLTRLQGQVDEIVVTDTGSLDDTPTLARDLGANVHHFPWIGDFSAARNFCSGKARGDYILAIDADEYAPEDLESRLQTFASDHPLALGRVAIRNRYFDPEGSARVAVSHATRFYPRDSGIEYREIVHERIVDSSGHYSRAETGVLLEHVGYALEPKAMAAKTRRNLQLLMRALDDQPEDPYLWFHMGKCHDALNDAAKAVACYQKSLEASSPSQLFRSELMVQYLYLLKRLNRQEEAFSLLLSALRAYPDMPDLHFFMGVALSHFGVPDLNLIRQCYETCVQIGEKTNKYNSVEGVGSYLAHFNLGAWHEAMGDLKTAALMYEKAGEWGYDTTAALARVKSTTL